MKGDVLNGHRQILLLQKKDVSNGVKKANDALCWRVNALLLDKKQTPALEYETEKLEVNGLILSFFCVLIVVAKKPRNITTRITACGGQSSLFASLVMASDTN